MFLKLFLITLSFVGIALLLLLIKILLQKGGRFGAHDVGKSKAMRERGIHCLQTQDKLAQADKTDVTRYQKRDAGSVGDEQN